MADRPIVFELIAEGAGEFGGQIAALNPIVAGFVAALGGAAAGVISLGQEMERQAGIWNHFRGDITQARQATNGLVSDLQLMTSHNELVRRGIQASGRDFRNVMVAALEQADASGRDFDQTFQQLTRQLVSGRETFEHLEQQFGQVEHAADTAGGKIEEFAVALENAETAFLEVISENRELQDVFDELTAAIVGTQTEWESFSDFLTDYARFAGAVVNEALALTIRHFRALAEAIQAVRRGDLGAALRGLREGTVGVVEQVTSGASGARVIQSFEASRRRAEERGNQDTGPTRIRRRRGGGGGGEEDDTAERLQREEEFWQETEELRVQHHHEELERMEEAARVQSELNQAVAEEWESIQESRKEKAREVAELEMESLEKQKEAAREAFENTKDDAQSILTPAISGLTKAVAEVAAGAKSADEAFAGLLSSFLEMISQQAALEAAKEFAAAIGAFAQYNYAGGALHIASGVAWTAVAVAAGAASIAVAPPAQVAPASPQSSGGGTGGGEQTVVINWNSPVITSGTRAELGREITGLIGEGERRFGRAEA